MLCSAQTAACMKENVKMQLDKMLADGVIVEADESEWCSPMVAVRKKNGDTRICTDFRHLNEAVKREPFQIPTLEDLLSQISGATYFSSLDARSGYYQIPISPDSQKYLVFCTPFGRFQYARLPFGLNSAPEIFSKVMSRVLDGLEGVLCYLDDVLVFGKSKEDHDERLRQVIERFRKFDLRLNFEKCNFCVQSVKFLGHVLSQDGVRPDPEKVSAVRDYPRPTSLTELRSFLGAAGYIGQKFVQNFASLSKPLWDILKRDAFEWLPEADKSFTAIKDAILEIQPLYFFDHTGSVVIQTDASGIGIGGTLMRDGKPILYTSRKLTDVETRYAQVEREFLAIVYACYRFKSFILGFILDEISPWNLTTCL